MIPAHVTQAVQQALYSLPAQMASEAAMVMLYAIGLQESKFEHRRQVVERGGHLVACGPAIGYWQFEKGGGVRGVVKHNASRYWMIQACLARHVPFHIGAIWHALGNDDMLAATAARLLIFTDPKRLPDVGDEKGAWDLYMRVWRPGKPHVDTWKANYGHAVGHVIG